MFAFGGIVPEIVLRAILRCFEGLFQIVPPPVDCGTSRPGPFYFPLMVLRAILGFPIPIFQNFSPLAYLLPRSNKGWRLGNVVSLW